MGIVRGRLFLCSCLPDFFLTHLHPLRYVDTLGGVAAFAACLHLFPSPPAAVCVDDISSLPPDGPRRDRRAMDGAVSRTLALLHDGLTGAW